MKKILVLLLLCVLVFSIMVNLTSCKWKTKDNPTPDTPPAVDENGNPVDADGGTNNNKIELPPIKIPGLTPDN